MKKYPEGNFQNHPAGGNFGMPNTNGVHTEENSMQNNPNNNPFMMQQNAMMAQRAVLRPPAEPSNQPDSSLSKNLSNSTRIPFIRKVYSILTCQFLITALITAAIYFSDAAQDYLRKNFWILIVSFAINIVCLYALACYPRVARKVPLNYILLLIFTLTMSLNVAFQTSFYSPKIVLSAVVLTALMTVGLTAYACYTKTDFTMMGGMLFAMSFVIMGMVVLGMFITSRFYHAVLCALMIPFFCAYIIYDTQLIVGKHSHKFQIDDYILGALTLYIDIINLFLTILRLLGMASGER